MSPAAHAVTRKLKADLTSSMMIWKLWLESFDLNSKLYSRQLSIDLRDLDVRLSMVMSGLPSCASRVFLVDYIRLVYLIYRYRITFETF